MDYGDTFTVTVSYKKFKDFVINVNINKLKNEVTLSATSKTYNGEPFKVEDLGVSANVNAGLLVEWYLGETKLASAPVNAGKYRVKIHIDSTKEYEKVDKFFDVEILKAEPVVDWTLISVSGTHLSTDKVSTIVLPEGFSWKNPDMLLGEGKSTHTVVYTPEDTNYKAVEKDFVGFSGRKHIILLSDGGENCDESPCDYSIELVKTRKDIKIDVIAFNVHDSEDLAQLKCTADVTGGHFVEADTNAELMRSMEEFTLPHKQVEALIYGVQ